ncbi:MAG: cell division protein FtsZ [Dehalococcoidia bacterium]|nr:MAG: cell division protein FtsZ [Dehalococcoidia bacterium]
MKLLVIGCGQCGGRIADEFARLNGRARGQRGIDIISNIIAVNTDIADLSGLSFIRPDQAHRVLIGAQKTGGHGVGKINELGAEIAREDGDKVSEAVKNTKRFHETDAFVVIASAAGGTGSGAISILTQNLKERYPEKPIYNVIVLPFRHEEKVEERTIYNTATCLKSAYLVADAVFLIDNQRYITKDASLQHNLAKINARLVSPFYNLLCAGEEKKPKYIGAKIIDAGDIIQTLSGWTVIGHGRTQIPMLKLAFGGTSDFRKQPVESRRGVQAMSDAISDLSLKCRPSDAKRALYLLSAPPDELNMSLLNEIGGCLKRVATEAIIRSGDYPREKRAIEVTLILSELTNVGKVMEYFTRAIRYISSYKTRWEGIEYEHRGIEDAFRDIPSLL